MRRSDREIHDRAEIEEIIQQAEICHLAMVDGEEPYIVTMHHGWYKGSLYLHCASSGKKLDILGKNPAVCFTVLGGWATTPGLKACDWSARYRSVVGFGRAEILVSAEDKRAGLDLIMARHAAGRHVYDEKALQAVTVIRVNVTRMTGKAKV